jgi:hypothetical protein
MEEPSVRTSRLAIAGGIAAVLLIGGGGFLLGRATVPPAPAAKPVPVIRVAPIPPATGQTQILDRGKIITAAAKVADSLSSGSPMPADLETLPGHRFALSLPFGCGGPASPDSPAPLRWHYDDATQTLRIHIALIVWQPDEWGLQSDAAAIPRGFWIMRPWSSAETCPAAASEAVASGTEPVTLPGQTLAVVSFGATAPKGAGAYEAVVRVPREKLDMAEGLRARLTGRIDRVPGGAGAIKCIQPAGIEQQPICAIAAVFDELVVDNPATGETIATWTLGKAGDVNPN